MSTSTSSTASSSSSPPSTSTSSTASSSASVVSLTASSTSSSVSTFSSSTQITSTISSSAGTTSTLASTPTSSTQSTVPSSCPQPGNLFVNPGFETNAPDPWVVGGDIPLTFSGAVAQGKGHGSATYYAITKTTFASQIGYYMSQTVALETSGQVEFSVWTKVTTPKVSTSSIIFYFGMDGYNFGTIGAMTLQGGEGWVQYKSGPGAVTAGTHEFSLSGKPLLSSQPIGTLISHDDFVLNYVGSVSALQC